MFFRLTTLPEAGSSQRRRGGQRAVPSFLAKFPGTNRRSLAGGLQLHSATASAGLVGNRIAGARPTAVAEMDPCPFQADPFQGFAAAANGCILRINLAVASPAAGAEKGFIPFDSDDMMPCHRLAAGAASLSGTHRVAFAGFAAAAGVERVLAGGCLRSAACCSTAPRQSDGEQRHRQAEKLLFKHPSSSLRLERCLPAGSTRRTMPEVLSIFNF